MGLFKHAGETLVGAHIVAWRVAPRAFQLAGKPAVQETTVWTARSDTNAEYENGPWIFEGDHSAALERAVLNKD